MLHTLRKYSLLNLLLVLLFTCAVLLPIGFDSLSVSTDSLYSVAYANENTDRSAQDSGWIETGVKNAFIYLLNFLLAAIIGLVGGILTLVGIGFDEAIRYTVTDFSSTFGPVSEGVSLAWSGFRDVANIVMIAMFVFVAFAVILNIEQYGLKRFGVRILVVAVLINFSLFFTKAIVDISNVTATQFRNAIQVENTSGEASGISDIFLQKSGIVEFSYLSAKATLDRIGTKGREAGFGKTLLYTFTLVVFYSALIAVLLFGLILLVTRMVVLTVLMFTSALAFIAYLIPKYGDGLWSKWWNALIQNALFAPLFMMMIWATVNVISKLGGEASPTLDKLVENSNTAWPAMLNLMVVVGLLYASTKVANELSIKGAGFGQKMLTKGALGIGTGIGTATLGSVMGLAGWAGRNTLGRAAARRAEDAELRRRAVEGNWAQRLSARTQLKASKKLAGMSFDLRDTKALKDAQKASGISLGKGTRGFDQYQKDEAKYVGDAAKAAGEIAKERAQAGAEATKPDAPVANNSGDEIVKALEKSNQLARKGQKADASQQAQLSEEIAATKEASKGTKESDIPTAGGGEQANQISGTDARIDSIKNTIQEQGKVRTETRDVQIPDLNVDVAKTQKDLDAIAADAEKEFLKKYEETGGFTRGDVKTRRRIADMVRGEKKKSKSDKKVEKLEGDLKSLKDKNDAT